MEDTTEPIEIAFEFNGFAHLVEEWSSTDKKSREIQNIYADCVEILNKNSYKIADEVSREIEEKVRRGIRVNTNINFSEGSIEWSGVIYILDQMARLGGAISLIQFLQNRIEVSVSKIVDKELPSFFKERKYKLVTSSQYREYETLDRIESRNESSRLQEQVDNSTREKPLFSNKQLLLWLTLVNLTLITGGTVYNTVQVMSITESYQEAKGQIDKAKSTYDSAQMELNGIEIKTQLEAARLARELQSSYDASLTKIISQLNATYRKNLEDINDKSGVFKDEVRIRKEEFELNIRNLQRRVDSTGFQSLSRLDSDLNNFIRSISGRKDSFNYKTKSISAEIQRSETDSKEVKDQLEILSKTVEKQKKRLDELNDSGFKITLQNVWFHTNWDVLILLILSIAISAVTLLLWLFRGISWIYRLTKTE